MKRRYKRRTTAALSAYAVAAKQTNEPDETNFVDFLADMLHLYQADPRALTDPSYEEVITDPVQWLQRCMDSAVNHYSAESGWPYLTEADIPRS